jgi:hypothetical protein
MVKAQVCYFWTDLGNIVERFIQQIKDRTECINITLLLLLF